MVGRLISHYAILDVIDAGGMGAVYKAEDTRLHILVALKLLPRQQSADAERRERFLREAQALSRISHPNVCRFLEYSQTRDGQPFLVMEYCEGETLAARLKREQLTIAAAIEIALQVASGLRAIHEHELVHRDINPRNLVIHPNGSVKIIDFGIARLLDNVSITSYGVRIGTPSYMSPEQMMGESGLNHRSDLWSFGVTLYEMLARNLPFGSEQYDALAYEITAEDPRPIEEFRPDVPAALAALIGRLLAKNPDARLQSAAGIEAELERIRDSGGERTKVLPPHPMMHRIGYRWRAATRGRWWLAIVLLIGVSLIPAYRPVSSWAAANRCVWLSGLILPGCELPAVKHIALMEFKAAGETESDRDFSAGLAEEIKNQLEDLPLSDASICIGRPHHREHYGDNLWLQGRIGRAGNSVQIAAEVRDPRRGILLRRQEIAVPSGDIYRIQQGLALELARLVEIDSKDARPAETTTDLRSLELYLRGLASLHRAQSAADAAERGKQAGEARERLRQVLRIDPYYGPAQIALASAISLDGSETALESALAHFREGIEQSTLKGGAHLARAHATLGGGYLSANRSQDAIAQFSQVIKIDPGNAAALRALGDAYAQLGRTEEAELAYAKAVSKRPHCWYQRWMLARFHSGQGCDGAASAQLERVIAEDPGNLLIRSALARLYIREEKYFQAEEQLLYVLAREPRPVAVSNLGWTYFLSQRYSESLTQMERAARMEPENPLLHGNVAEVARFVPAKQHQSEEEYRRAVVLARQKMKEDSATPFDRSWLSYWLACLGEAGPALEEIEAVLTETPNSKDTQFRAAIVYEMSGYREKALAALERALRLGYSITEIHRSERLAGLMNTPDYQELERRVSKQNEVSGQATGCASDTKFASTDGEPAKRKASSN